MLRGLAGMADNAWRSEVAPCSILGPILDVFRRGRGELTALEAMLAELCEKAIDGVEPAIETSVQF
jgi:hypothetical protein